VAGGELPATPKKFLYKGSNWIYVFYVCTGFINYNNVFVFEVAQSVSTSGQFPSVPTSKQEAIYMHP
jgi:hypothetical protein